MYRHYDTANAFGSAEDDAPNSCDAPAEQSWNAAPALSDSLLTTQQQQPSTATPAEPPVQPTTTTTYSCTQPTNSRGVTRDRTPLPRCAAPAEKAAVPTVQGAPHQTHPLELKVVEEEVVEEGAMTGTPTSSTTWCSPVQVLPNRITSKKTCGTAGLSAEDPFLLRSTTAAHDVALGASGSGERRSVTVTQQPYSLNHVNHSDYAREYDVCQAKSSGEVADASRLKRAARLLSHDFEAPGRAAEEMKEWRAAETQRRSLQPVAPAPEVLPSPSSPASSASSSSFATPTPAAAGAAEAVASNSVILVSDDAHTKTTASPLNAGGIGRGPERKEDDYGVVSIGVAGAPAQPTPYPVTSTSSLSDWSSAPRLGLPAPTSPSAAEAEVASLPRRDAEERKREDRWYRLCRGVSLLASASPESIVRLRAVARKYGIPHHLRGVMWLTLTGMALKVDENEYFCAMLLRRNGYVTGDNAAAIAADVQRTFPSHPYFSERDVGIYKLTNVLHALCWRNPLLSYCQSFNFLAAFLLLVLDDEERVFWLLIHIFEELLPNDFYGETLLGANVEQAVLERLVRQKLPRVAARFSAVGLQVHALVANWMMSMFVNVVPPATLLRLWDYVFCRTTNPGERTPAHLEITLAILKYLEERNLLAGEDEGELLMTLREQTACLYDASAVIRLANDFAISPDELHQLRREAKPTVVQTLKARERARATEQERRLAQELQLARKAVAPASLKE